MVEYLLPRRLDEALRALSERTDAVPVAGATDVMVRMNLRGERPPAALDLSRLRELAGWAPEPDGRRIRVGALVPYTRLVDELAGPLPGLVAAARTVGSRQIRNRGTLGGALGTASPTGDAHPALLACDARVELSSVRGVRTVPVADFYAGPHRTVRRPEELITAVLLPVAEAPQTYAKVGRRGAVVISTCSFALALWPSRGEVGTGMGAVADTPRRAVEAERFLGGELSSRGLWHTRGPLPEAVVRRFGELAAAAADPADDVRGTAAYRRHAVGVLARRTLARAWQDYRTDQGTWGIACA
ncbi:FAD binding domain-containing protein [Streptomyces gamaensis]|uniref:FAD binding domain-containing protein n=1 Tax=Streptomyces gamaensis TaxID=1763542 RepID=A0ABW0Z574_9ACTN